MVASTIITAPSTISPKSIAPRLIKFPDTPKTFINATANSIAKGITEATIKPERIFPRKRTKTNITINAPSIKFFCTVLMALSTNSLLSRKGSISTPSGKVFRIWSILSFTRPTTSEALLSFNSNTIPPTASLSFLVSAPYRVAVPN